MHVGFGLRAAMPMLSSVASRRACIVAFHSGPHTVARCMNPSVDLLSLRGGDAAQAALASPTTLVASGLGWVMTAAALNLYTPMIVELAQKRKAMADGMSLTTWSLQLMGFAIFCTYSLRSGYRADEICTRALPCP